MPAVQRAPRRARAGQKSASAFRTISEVSELLDVPQHVLRFWETKFSQIKPLKRGGGRRYYRPEDIALLRRIRALLYDDGYTIKGAQRLVRSGAWGKDEGAGRSERAAPRTVPRPMHGTAAGPPIETRDDRLTGALRALRDELVALRDQIRGPGA